MNLAKLLILAGAVLIAAGLLVLVAAKLGFGRLPGDILIRGERFSFYFPIVSCLLLSALVTFILWLLRWRP